MFTDVFAVFHTDYCLLFSSVPVLFHRDQDQPIELHADFNCFFPDNVFLLIKLVSKEFDFLIQTNSTVFEFVHNDLPRIGEMYFCLFDIIF